MEFCLFIEDSVNLFCITVLCYSCVACTKLNQFLLEIYIATILAFKTWEFSLLFEDSALLVCETKICLPFMACTKFDQILLTAYTSI